jgi:hypothetical protein
VDEGQFIRFLVAQGYTGPEARALAGQAHDDDTDYLDIRDRNDRVVEVEVDTSMGFAGELRFIVPGEPGWPEERTASDAACR